MHLVSSISTLHSCNSHNSLRVELGLVLLYLLMHLTYDANNKTTVVIGWLIGCLIADQETNFCYNFNWKKRLQSQESVWTFIYLLNKNVLIFFEKSGSKV